MARDERLIDPAPGERQAVRNSTNDLGNGTLEAQSRFQISLAGPALFRNRFPFHHSVPAPSPPQHSISNLKFEISNPEHLKGVLLSPFPQRRGYRCPDYAGPDRARI